MQVTDATDGYAAAYHAYSNFTSFNADSTMFLIAEADSTGNAFWYLYGFDPTTLNTRKIGSWSVENGLNRNTVEQDYAYAQWDPVQPNIFYTTVPDTTIRQLWQYNVTTDTWTLIRDFTVNVTPALPTGGYTSGLQSDHSTGRYFTFWVSAVPGQGQDSGLTAVVYDKQTDTVYQITLTSAQMNGGGIHSLYLDKGGNTVTIQPTSFPSNTPAFVVWYFKTGMIANIMNNATDQGPGHDAWGTNLMVNESTYYGGQWLLRTLSPLSPPTPIFTIPLVNGTGHQAWLEDSHISWNHTNTGYVFGETLAVVAAQPDTGWTVYSGSVYQLQNWLANDAFHQQPVGEVLYQGKMMTAASGIPTAAGQWYYDATADTLYVWPTDGADLTVAENSDWVVPINWYAYLDEVVQAWTDGSGTVRRLAHHHSHQAPRDPYRDQPHSSSDWLGQFVMFTSNWERGSLRTDVFIVKVPQ